MAWKISKVRGPWESEADSDERYTRGPRRGEYRELMVEIEPRCFVFRPKGTRRRLRLSMERAYQLACQIEAESRRNKKRQRRSVRRSVLAIV
jgi:hypothetical protein